MDLTVIKDAFDRTIKKRKLSASTSQEVIDRVGQEIEQALARIQSSTDPVSFVNQKSILAELKSKVNAIDPLNQLEGSQRDLNISLTKFPKLLEKSFNPDISKAFRNVEFDIHIVNQIIASHFYQQGLFELGDRLVNEAGELDVTSIRSQFWEMHEMIHAMRVKNLVPALNWASINRERLEQNGSNLELKLHHLQFVETLRNGSQADALAYAKTHLAAFATNHMSDFRKLMGCIVWKGKLEKCPRSELLSPTHWENLAEELGRDFCMLLGQSFESPLSMIIAAGIDGLPTLLKLANVMAAKKAEWHAMKQLPVPVELGKEYQFHSIFVCPVSREQSTEENPPMLLPCLHVLCKQSITKLSRGSARTFKCPYCPREASVTECRRLYF